MTELLGFGREDVERISSDAESPDWIREKRATAWKAYENLPMPTLRDEMWKYTDLSGLNFKNAKTSEA